MDSAGAQADGHSYRPAITADGRYVAFKSLASNLVPDDTNATYDVFVRDTVAGTTTRVSVDSTGVQADGDSGDPAMSADGRYVAFTSLAFNLVPDDTNATYDVFVRDTVAGTTTRVSVGAAGAEADRSSNSPDISADGRYVAFESNATNLVTGDTNGVADVFVRDMVAGTTVRVSVDSAGAQATSIPSAGFHPTFNTDGRYVAFNSYATNLAPGDTNGTWDVFVRDMVAGTTTLVSVNNDGAQGNGASGVAVLSANGRYVAFRSVASNLVAGDTNSGYDIFVRDTMSGTTTRVSVDSAGAQATGGGSFDPAISNDGRYVAFESGATNLVNGDSNAAWDVFVRDTVVGTTVRVSVDSAGAQADGQSINAAISADGRSVAFQSDATNLVAGDTNSVTDVFRAPAH